MKIYTSKGNLYREFNGTYKRGDFVLLDGHVKSVNEVTDIAVGLGHDWYHVESVKPCSIPIPNDVTPNDVTPNDVTNPKAAYGDEKIPLHLWPSTATVLGCMAFMEGSLKYGRCNFRSSHINVTTYYAALNRHINSFYEGEWIDKKSGIPHLGKALACIAVMIDAHYAGTLVDDRQYPGGYDKAVEEMEKIIKPLQEQHKDKTPKHYTIKDREQ